jgi:alpha-tubulin suppressor-like RCC1 family protein
MWDGTLTFCNLAKQIQENMSMENYSGVKPIRFFPSILVFLLSMVAIITISGCGRLTGNQKYSISGTVRIGGVPLPGVTIELSGDASDEKQTDEHGHYRFDDVKEGQYRVKPLLEGYNFTPVDSKVYLFGMDATGFNFSVTAQGSVAAGKFHTVALKSDGTVWAWGSNSNGQLGDGTTTDSVAPVQVSGLSDVTAIAAGSAYTVALKSDGTVWAWGSNSNGQLGDGTTTDSVAPVQVSDLADVTAIAAGEFHTVALKGDRTVWTWGANDSGQLGHGGTTQKIKPAQVANLADVTAIAAGSAHTVVLRKDGKVRAWGDNSSGQLGIGNTDEKKTSPVDVKKLSDVIAIAAGGFHTVALKSDGTVWAWGNNSNGQLGDGTTTDMNLPVEINDFASAIAITAGYQHTASIVAAIVNVGTIDETFWAWGGNVNGQLGNGTTTDSAVPVPVLPF